MLQWKHIGSKGWGSSPRDRQLTYIVAPRDWEKIKNLPASISCSIKIRSRIQLWALVDGESRVRMLAQWSLVSVSLCYFTCSGPGWLPSLGWSGKRNSKNESLRREGPSLSLQNQRPGRLLMEGGRKGEEGGGRKKEEEEWGRRKGWRVTKMNISRVIYTYEMRVRGSVTIFRYIFLAWKTRPYTSLCADEKKNKNKKKKKQ